jgi:hypothetical protein
MNKMSGGHIISCGLVVIAAVLPMAMPVHRVAGLPQDTSASVWQAGFDAWQVTFLDQESRLTCLHRDTGTRLEGTLSFRAGKDEGAVLWQVGLPLDSVRNQLALLALHPDTGRPQLVFSDRHLTLGGVDLLSLAWDNSRRILSGVVDLVGNHPTELVIAVPDDYRLNHAWAGEGVTIEADPAGALATITLRCAEPGPASWRLEF